MFYSTSTFGGLLQNICSKSSVNLSMRHPTHVLRVSMNEYEWSFPQLVSNVSRKSDTNGYAIMAVNLFGLAYNWCYGSTKDPELWQSNVLLIEDADRALGTRHFCLFASYMTSNKELITKATLSSKKTYTFRVTISRGYLHFTPLHNTNQKDRLLRFAHFPVLEAKIKTTPPCEYRSIVRASFSAADIVFYMFELQANSKYNNNFQTYMRELFPFCSKIETITELGICDIFCTTDQGTVRVANMSNDFCQTFLMLITIYYDKITYEHRPFSYLYTLSDHKFVVPPRLKEIFRELSVQVIYSTKPRKKRKKRTIRSTTSSSIKI
jgi:hypothetical protein